MEKPKANLTTDFSYYLNYWFFSCLRVIFLSRLLLHATKDAILHCKILVVIKLLTVWQERNQCFLVKLTGIFTTWSFSQPVEALHSVKNYIHVMVYFTIDWLILTPCSCRFRGISCRFQSCYCISQLLAWIKPHRENSWAQFSRGGSHVRCFCLWGLSNIILQDNYWFLFGLRIIILELVWPN